MGVVEESFRWDTANVETCAAQYSALLDTCDLVDHERLIARLDIDGRLHTFKPSCPALMAATYPATPPPIMTTSCSSAQYQYNARAYP